MTLVLSNPEIGLYQVLPHWARVDLGAMTMKGHSVFPKAPISLEPHHQCLVSYLGHSLQLVYATVPADWLSIRCILQPLPTGPVCASVYVYMFECVREYVCVYGCVFVRQFALCLQATILV